MTRRRVAFFGGSFDPPHVAHVLSAVYVLKTQPVDEVLVVPVYEHPFGKQLAPFEHRVALCELAFSGVANVTVSRIEEELPRPNRTLYTLRRLAEQRPADSFRLLVGSDVIADSPKWHAWDEVTRLAPALVVARPGHPLANESLVLPDVSSTRVRELLRSAGEDRAAAEELSSLVPDAVLGYARKHGLYGSGSRPAAPG